MAVMLIAGSFIVIPAGAGLADQVRIADLDCVPSPAELEDIAFVAEQDGMEMEEAIERLGWQSCFSEAVAYLQAAYPQTYAGAAITDGGRAAWIGFTGQVPDDAVQLAAQIPVAVQLRGNQAFSEAELNQALQAVHGAVSRHEQVVAAAGSFDLDTGVITIQAQPRDTLDQSERERLLTALQQLAVESRAMAVEVVLVDELGGSDQATASPGRSVTPALALIGMVLAAAGTFTFGRRRSRRRLRV